LRIPIARSAIDEVHALRAICIFDPRNQLVVAGAGGVAEDDGTGPAFTIS
jgi:hypothetical protein